MKSITKRLFLLLLSIILIFNFNSIKGTAGKSVTKTVRVGYYQNEVFQEGASDKAVKSGYAYEYYRKLSEYTGWNYEYIYGDFVTIYNMLLNGDVDLVAGLAYTESRSHLISYPDKPQGTEQYSIVKHQGDDTITTNPTTLNGKSVGVLDSAIKVALENFLEKKNIAANVVTFSDYDALLEAFDKREVDTLAGESDGIYDRSHAETLYPFGETDYFICTSKDRPDLLKELNEAQSQLFLEYPDYISVLRNKYYPETLASRAFTSSEKEWLTSHESVVVGYLNNFLPYSDTAKDGKVTGLIKELVPYLFKQLGYETVAIEYVGFDTYDELVKAMDDEEIELAFPVGGGLFFSEEDGMFISKPVISSLTDLIYSTNYYDNSKQIFAVNESNKLQYYYIANHYPDATIEYYPSIDACLKAVLKGEATYTTLNGLRTASMLKNPDYEKLSFRQLGYADDMCFGVKIGNEGLLKLIDRGLSRAGTEYVNNLGSVYSDNMYKYTFKDVLRENFIGAFIVFLIILAILILLLLYSVRINRKRIREKEDAKREIEAVNQEKFVFLNKMNNYMREPINNIVSLIRISENMNDLTNIKNNLAKMGSFSKELTTILNNILNISSFESGQVKIDDNLSLYNFFGKRVLIVEDTLPNQTITGNIMKKAGMEVQIANDGLDAYEKVKAAPSGYFDAVLINVDDRNIQGYLFIKKIRDMENDIRSEVPVIAITADESESGKEKIIKSGMNGYITKPYDIKAILDKLSGIIL